MLAHYGDWETEFLSGKMVYYEKYANNEFRFYGPGSSLRNDTPAVGDGYGIVFDTRPTAPFTATYIKADGTEETIEVAIETIYPVNTVEKSFYIVPLPDRVINSSYVPENFYQKLVINDEDTYYYSPHFARAAIETKTAPSGVQDKIVRIRSARQLHNLSLYYSKYAAATGNCVFNQEADIEYPNYEWTTFAGKPEVRVQAPIGNDAAGTDSVAFRAVYEGNYYRITGVSFESATDNYVGLFGRNTGILRNIAVVTDYNAADKNHSLYVKRTENIGANTTVYIGVLAGENAGTITNCAAAGYYISGKSGTIYAYRNSAL